MPQPRWRNQTVQIVGIGRETDYRGNPMKPIFEEILSQGMEDDPGYLSALLAIQEMRDWGVEVTLPIARRCVLTHMYRESEQARYRQDQAQRKLAKHHPPIVYYMRLGTLVKIGFTENLTQRLDAIHPQELMVTEPGGVERERERHQEFANLREHGEWFRLEPPLMEHIEAVRREAAGD